jgi:hypothetical protein
MPREKNPTSPPAKKSAPRKTLALKQAPAPAAFVDPAKRASLIAEAAYFRAQRRGFEPGYETEDWLAAEAEVDASYLKAASAPGTQPPS